MLKVNKKQSTILVVDDDMAMRILMRQTLEQTGFRVTEASNGLEALFQLESEKPDLILLDVNMPEMNGFEACKAIRAQEDQSEIPVVMVTGLDDLESVTQAYEYGATDFIFKPVNWLVLGHRVKYILKASKAFQDIKKRESQLREVQDMVRVGHFEWHAESEMIYFSDSLLEIIDVDHGSNGWTYDEFMSWVDDRDKKLIAKLFNDNSNTASFIDKDFRVNSKQGEPLIFRINAKPVFDSAGRLINILGVLQDITQQKRAELKEQRLNLFLQSSFDEIFVLSARTLKFVEVNARALENTAYSMQEFEKMSIFKILPHLKKETFVSFVKALQSKSKDEIVFETTLQRKDKLRYQVEVRLQFINDKDDPVFLFLIQDISEKKIAREIIQESTYSHKILTLEE